MGGSATRGRHHLGIPFDLIQPAPEDVPANTQEQRSRTHANPRSAHTQNFSVPDGAGSWSSPSRQGAGGARKQPLSSASWPKQKPEQFPTSSAKLSKLPSSHAGQPSSHMRAQHAFAASLLDLDCAGTSTPDGDTPSISQLLSEAPLPPPPTSRLPARP